WVWARGDWQVDRPVMSYPWLDSQIVRGSDAACTVACGLAVTAAPPASRCEYRPRPFAVHIILNCKPTGHTIVVRLSGHGLRPQHRVLHRRREQNGFDVLRAVDRTCL